MSADEWMNIPEVGDARNKKMRNPRAERYEDWEGLLLTEWCGRGCGWTKKAVVLSLVHKILVETLYNIAQHSTTLHNTLQHCTTLYNIAQHYTTLHNTTDYTTLHKTTKHCKTLHNTIQHCTTLQTTQHCTKLQNIAQHSTTLHNIVQHSTTLHNIVQHDHRFTPLPDSVLSTNLHMNDTNPSIDPRISGMTTPYGGHATPSGRWLFVASCGSLWLLVALCGFL